MHVLMHAAVVHAVARELLYILLVLRMDARAVVRELPVLRTLRPRASSLVYSLSQQFLLALRCSQVDRAGHVQPLESGGSCRAGPGNTCEREMPVS